MTAATMTRPTGFTFEEWHAAMAGSQDRTIPGATRRTLAWKEDERQVLRDADWELGGLQVVEACEELAHELNRTTQGVYSEARALRLVHAGEDGVAVERPRRPVCPTCFAELALSGGCFC